MDPQGIPDLRRYPAAAAVALAEGLRARFASGLLEAGYLESRLRFRDDSGQAWCPGLRSGRWYRYRAGAWVPEGSLPAVLEGPAEWSRLLPTAQEIRSPVPESEVATRLAGRGGLAAVTQALKGLKDGYEAGSVTSAGATALLEDLAVLGPDGTAWAPGFQTGGWYALRPSGWERIGDAPDPQRLQFSGPLPPETAQALLERLEANPVPEPVARPWRPVEGYPERLTCPFCGAAQTSEQQTCWNCGQSTPVLASAVPAGVTPTPAPAPLPPASPAPPTVRDLPAPDGPVAWRLVLVEGQAPKPAYELGTSLAIGRESDNQVQLADVRASRYHAIIERAGEAYRVRDLGSSNGTYLNGVQLTAPAALRHGDRIQIGDVLFTVQSPPVAAGAPGPAMAGQPGAAPGPGMAAPSAAAAAPGAGQPWPAGATPGAGPPSPAAAGMAPAAGAVPQPPKPRRRRLRWIGIGCLALLALAASLVACGLALSVLDRF